METISLFVGRPRRAGHHAVPASEHVPKFLASPSWADAWRGGGSVLASFWFILPLPMQARALNWFARVVRFSESIGADESLNVAVRARSTNQSFLK